MEALATAAAADRLGYDEIWIGEMATFDAFALATAIGVRPGRSALTIGPLAPAVRDAAGLAMGAASVAALTSRSVHLAIGASSPVVVERWHGRQYAATAPLLSATVAQLQLLLAGAKAAPGGYRLRLPAVSTSITVAAFGPAAVRVAGEVADRMVINMCTPRQAARMRMQLDDHAQRSGRAPVRLAAWVPAAVEPTEAAIDQLRRGIVAYLGAPGYGEMFAESGFGRLVELARSGAHPGDVLAAVPRELIEAVGLIGDEATCRAQLAAHLAAGVDDVVIVPATAGDDAGVRTLTLLAPRRGVPGSEADP